MDDISKVENSYGAEQITVLKGLEPVRKRPGMFRFSAETNFLHHWINESFSNIIY